jgi:hypothetical protein
MKLQLEAYKKKYTIETENDDLDIYEYLDMFKGLLIQSGWQQQTINEAIIELAESFKED